VSTLQRPYDRSVGTLDGVYPGGRPRLLYVITRAERGGAQTHVLDLALGIREQFEVHVATGEEGFLTDACRQQSIPVYVLPHMKRDIRPFHDLRALYDLGRLMRRLEPALVHAHTFKAGFLGRFLAKRLKIPSIYTAHLWPFGEGAPLQWRVAAPLCERMAAGWCDKIISVSELGAQEAMRFKIGGPPKLVSIVNGIPDHPARARLDHEKGLSCTMVARFAPFKDHGLLLRAFARIPGESRLKLVGDGSTNSFARDLAKDLGIRERVEFKGSRGDVAEVLAQTDVFVLASKKEALPISILEAMRAGLPVVASDVGGVSEEVIDGETGFVVTPGSVDEMTTALTRLLTDKALRITMGRAGRRRFEQLFRADKMIERTEAVYTQVLEARLAGR
jgi:glycosyltransferase involved in cell wall biosynthesis